MSRVLLVGPRPARGLGGVTTFVELFQDRLGDRHQLRFVNTAWHERNEPRTPRAVARGSVAIPKQLVSLVRALWLPPRPDICHFACAFRPGPSSARDALFAEVITRSGVPLIANLRGGAFVEQMESMSKLGRRARLAVLSRSSAVVVQTRQIERWLVDRLPQTRIWYLPNCIDVESTATASESKREPGDPLKVVFSGLVHEEKGALDLIRAAIVYRGGAPLHVSIFGKLAPANSSAALELASRVQSPHALRLVGEVPRSTVLEGLRRAHLFVFPSRWRGEGQPNSILEAMAAGLPIVTTSWRGIQELCPSPQHSWLVDHRDPHGLARCMEYAATSERERVAMGRRNRQRVIEQFSAARMIEDLENIYGDVLQRPE